MWCCKCYCWWCEKVRVWVGCGGHEKWWDGLLIGGLDKINNSSPLDHSLPCIFYCASFSSFFYLHQSVHASFLWILLLFESCCGFYWFLNPVLLYSQHSKFSLWVAWAKKFGNWVICWPVNGMNFKWTCQDMEVEWEVLKLPWHLIENQDEPGGCWKQ